MVELDIAEQRRTIDRIVATAEALSAALAGPAAHGMSLRKLTRATLAIVEAQIDLAHAARLALDALEQATKKG